MAELKACPFCGGEAKFESKVAVYPIQDENGAYIDADIVYFECTGCPACDIWFYSDDDDEPEEITIERWNRRAIADVAPIKHAKWIDKSSKKLIFGRVLRDRIVQCDQCRNYLDMDGVNGGRGDANYCPNCGARMDAKS